MNAREIEIITTKLKACNEIIKFQHRLPKFQRDLRKLADVKQRQTTLSKWLQYDKN